MAKGIDINGQLRGKRGGMVYYRANGQQVSRARNFSPKNPKSAKQAVQRMVLSTAAKMTAALKPIVDHSFEGIAEGDISVRHFRKLAMDKLRNIAAVYINGDQSQSAPANFALMGAPIVGVAEGITISRGSLSMHTMTYGTQAFNIATDGDVNAEMTTYNDYVARLAALGLKPGDQLTLVVILRDINTIVAEFNDYKEFAQYVRFARVTFKTFSEETFVPGTILSNAKFNPAYLQESEGTWPDISTTASLLSFDMAFWDGLSSMAATVIRSQKSEIGWSYSNANLLADRDEFDANDAIDVYPSYMAGATPINVGDELYLQHAVAAPLS